VDELTVNDYMLAWDGRVLEAFGAHTGRFHIAFLSVTVSEPDRKGRVWLDIRSPRLTLNLSVPAGDADAVRAFVAPIQQALDAGGGHAPPPVSFD
jgi:hypothetical protein